MYDEIRKELLKRNDSKVESMLKEHDRNLSLKDMKKLFNLCIKKDCPFTFQFICECSSHRFNLDIDYQNIFRDSYNNNYFRLAKFLIESSLIIAIH